MAQAKTFRFSDVMILLGDGATPAEVFAAPCGLTELGMTIASDTNESIIPDCDNPDDPAWKITDITALQMTLSGQGVLDRAARKTWEDWAFGGTEKTVRWVYDVTAADFGGYYQAPAILTNYQVTAQRGQRATVQIAITLNGKPAWTAAA
jgi:hypothetical protein